MSETLGAINVVRRGGKVILVIPSIDGRPPVHATFEAGEAILFGESIMTEAKVILGHKIETLAGIKQLKEDQIRAVMRLLQPRCENIVKTALEASPPWANSRIVKAIIEECGKEFT